jgi:hypothetical protein
VNLSKLFSKPAAPAGPPPAGSVACQACGQTGQIGGQACGACNGSGVRATVAGDFKAGQSKIFCMTCRGAKKNLAGVACAACGGTGFQGALQAPANGRSQVGSALNVPADKKSRADLGRPSELG